MKRGRFSRRFSRGSILPVAALASAAFATVGWRNYAQAQTLYWDINGTTSGAGGTTPAGTWDLTTPNWNTSTLGTNAGTAWASGNAAVFAAGANATGAYTVTIPTGITIPGVNGITYEEGTVTLNGGTIVLTDPSISTINSPTINSVIGGSVGLNRLGGTLTLTLGGSNTYTGVTSITSAGTVLLTNGGALGSSAPADNVVFNVSATTASFAGRVALAGNINVNKSIVINGGSGTVSFGELENNSGNNTWSGPVTLAGTVGNLGAGLPEIGATAGTLTISGQISGTGAGGSFGKTGPGALVLTSANTYTGITRLFGGTLQIATDGALGASAQDDFGIAILSGNNAYLPSMLLLKNPNGDLKYTAAEGAALIAGTPYIGHGILESDGGDNSYAGQIQLANPAPFGSTDVNIVQPTQIGVVSGTLTLNSTFAGGSTAPLGGPLVNSSTSSQRYLQKVGAGALVIATSAGWAGPTAVEAGTLSFALTGQDLGMSGLTSALWINSGAGLKFDNTNGVLAQRLDPNGVHNVDLFGGDFTMTGQLNNSPVSVTTTTVGQTLHLYGTSSVTIANPGAGAVLDLSAANVNRESNATAVFRGAIGSAAGAGVGNILLPANLNTTIATGTGAAIIPWALGDSSITGSGTDFVTYDATNGVKLLTTYVNTNAISGASGDNYQLSNSPTVSAPSTVNSVKFALGSTGITLNADLMVGSGAILNATGGTVTINGSSNLQFSGAEGIIHALGNVVVNAPIKGTAGLTKGSNGDLILTNVNNDFGTLTVNAGNVIITNDSQLGPNGNRLVINGGYLKPGAAVTALDPNRPITLASRGGFDIGTGQNLTLAHGLEGAGTLDKRGGGTLILSADNSSFGGAITLSAGTVQFSADNNLGDQSGASTDSIRANSANLVFNGGTLRMADNAGTVDIASSRAIVLNQVGTIDVGTNSTYNEHAFMYGPGSLVKTGQGTLSIFSSGASQMRYIGPNTVLGGVLQYQSSSGLNLIPPFTIANFWTLDNGASLDFSPAIVNTATTRGITLGAGGGGVISSDGADYSFGGPIVGPGAFTKSGNGNLALGSANTYTKGTFVTGGTLSIAADNRLGAGGASVTLDGAALRSTAAATFSMGARQINIGANGGTLDTGSSGFANTGIVAGVGAVVKVGSLQFNTAAVRTGGIDIEGGTIAVSSTRSAANVSSTATLTINTGNSGVLNLNNNDLVYNYANAANPAQGDPQKLVDIRTLIQSGFSNGTTPWTGTSGITSGVARTDNAAATPKHTALGYAEASTVGITGTYDSQPVDANTVIVRYTYFGDANLDGKVNGLDFNALATNFGLNGGNNVWSGGDFNYDGNVDTSDFTALSQNFNAAAIAARPLDGEALGSLVPEPSMLAALAVSACALRARRRRV